MSKEKQQQAPTQPEVPTKEVKRLEEEVPTFSPADHIVLNYEYKTPASCTCGKA